MTNPTLCIVLNIAITHNSNNGHWGIYLPTVGSKTDGNKGNKVSEWMRLCIEDHETSLGMNPQAQLELNEWEIKAG